MRTFRGWGGVGDKAGKQQELRKDLEMISKPKLALKEKESVRWKEEKGGLDEGKEDEKLSSFEEL